MLCSAPIWIILIFFYCVASHLLCWSMVLYDSNYGNYPIHASIIQAQRIRANTLYQQLLLTRTSDLFNLTVTYRYIFSIEIKLRIRHSIIGVLTTSWQRSDDGAIQSCPIATINLLYMRVGLKNRAVNSLSQLTSLAYTYTQWPIRVIEQI